MYYRISGAQFTIRSAEEKKDFIDIINQDKNFSNHLVCRGVNAEQFTGKVNGVIVCEKDNPNKVYIFSCEGNFPTLKLYQRTSSVVYIIEFPVSKKGQIVLEAPKEEEPKKEELPPAAVSDAIIIDDDVEIVKVEEPVEEIPVEEPQVEEPVEPEETEINQFAAFEVEDPMTEEQPEQPIKKRRGRKKKS